jgi:hypothetical protein
VSDVIFCCECKSWFHRKCEHLTLNDFKKFARLVTIEYVCAGCHVHSDGLGYNAAMVGSDSEECHRSAMHDIEALTVAAEAESIYLCRQQLPLSYQHLMTSHSSFGSMQSGIIRHCGQLPFGTAVHRVFGIPVIQHSGMPPVYVRYTNKDINGIPEQLGPLDILILGALHPVAVTLCGLKRRQGLEQWWGC